MAVKNQDVMLRVLGADAAAGEYRKVGAAGKGMGTSVKSGAKEAKDGLQGVEAQARKLPADIERAGSSGKSLGRNIKAGSDEARRGLDQAGQSAYKFRESIRQIDDVAPALSRAGGFAQKLGSNLDSLSEKGLKIGAVGVGGILLSKSLAQAGNEGEAAGAKVEAMFAKIGAGSQEIDSLKENLGKLAFDAALPDDDELLNAAAGLAGFGMEAKKVEGLLGGMIGQSRLYGQSLESVSEAVGRAFAKGDLDSLARIGVVISEEQKAMMKGLEDSGASLAQKQAAMYDILRDSFSKYALSLTEGMSEGEIAANRQALALDNLQTTIGTGAARAQKELQQVGAQLFNIAGANPALAEGAGYLGTYGAYAVASVGGLISFGAELGQLAIGYDVVKKAMIASRGAANAQTVAITASGNASAAAGIKAGIAAGGFIALAAAAGLALAAIGLAVYSWEKNKDKILNPTSSTEDTRTDDQKQDDQSKFSQVNRIQGEASALPDREKYVVLRKATQAYLDLGQVDAAAETSAKADAIRKTLPQNYTDVNSPEAKALIAQLSGLNASANKGARFDGSNFKGYEVSSSDADEAKASSEDIKKQIAALNSGQAPASGLASTGLATAPVLNLSGLAAKAPATPPVAQDFSQAMAISQGVAAMLGSGMGYQVGGGMRGVGGADPSTAALGGGPQSMNVNLNIKTRTTQDASGDIRVKLNAEDIVIPYMGIGSLRGQF